MTDSLERALYELDFDVPDGLLDRAVAGAAHAPAGGTARQRILDVTRIALARVAALVVAVLFVNLVAAYLAPRYGQALADAPVFGAVAGPVLRYSGLDASQITRLNVSATSAGHTIKVVGGYADTDRTVLLLEFDGKPHRLPSKSIQDACCFADGTLTDQFALQYHRVNNPDQLAATFEPLRGPASQVGARLTLHVTMLGNLGPKFIQGDWSLTVTLVQQAGKVLATPEPVTANGVTYKIKYVHLSGKLIKISLDFSGQPVDDETKLAYAPKGLSQPPSPSAFSQNYFAPNLVDAQGNKAFFYEWGYGLPKQGPAWGTLTAVVPGPGHYTLTFGNHPGAASFPIEIP